MNIEYFKESVEALSHEIAHCLCPGKIALIKHSLIILQTENKLKSIYFWGRLNGIANDFYIAFGYTQNILNDRRYFYSNDCNEWYYLPTDSVDDSSNLGLFGLSSTSFRENLSDVDQVVSASFVVINILRT